ncbi:MAG TPA: hypothetical protein VI935_03225 [Thermodesulfobacteriota bacterium]|nr:hypothetical protein [Thermodesulfobacteriota bacterium]
MVKTSISITRKLLGDLLLEAGVITEDQLREAHERQWSQGGRILSLLVELGFITETKLKDFLTKKLKLPLLNPLTSQIEEDTLKLITAETAYKLKVIPVRLEKNLGRKILILATSDPDIEIADAVSFITGLDVKLGYASEMDIETALKQYYRNGKSVSNDKRPNKISEKVIYNTPLEECEKSQQQLINSLNLLLEDTKRSIGDFGLPSWCNSYTLPTPAHEFELRGDIQNIEKEINSIKDKISKHKDLTWKLEQRKILFTGTGKEIEDQVKEILEEMGFTFMEGLQDGEGLIFKYNDRITVVEIKGVPGSALEKHAIQLEKGIIDYYSSHEVMPKGVLVVNVYKDTPLDDRNGAPFPSNLISYSEKRDHCLITGLQLLGLYLDCKNNPDKKAQVIASIFSTSGVFGYYQDWRGFLKLEESIR